MTFQPIENHGIIGNLCTAALVSCPGDFVRADAAGRVGVSPAEWLG
jgi:hypothetical protein